MMYTLSRDEPLRVRARSRGANMRVRVEPMR